jgi:hypothetical protein
MAPFNSICAAALLLASSASGHFLLRTPPTIGFDDSKEDTAPCGGFTPDFSKTVTDFHVGGEPIGTSQSHPSARWLYRATLDQTASGGWTQLYPIVLQNSLGFMCIQNVPAPEAWVGKRGVVGIVANGDDGLLYQVSFVSLVHILQPAGSRKKAADPRRGGQCYATSRCSAARARDWPCPILLPRGPRPLK